MDSQVGPVEAPKPRTRKLSRGFEDLVKSLGIWRNEDHEDALWLSRSDVIELIEGIATLRSRISDDPSR